MALFTVQQLIEKLKEFPPDAIVRAGDIPSDAYLSDSIEVCVECDDSVSITGGWRK